MARDGSGNYTNPYPNFVAGTVVVSAEVDANNSDIATALTQSIAVDGQSTITANIPMASFKFTGLADGSAAQDSATVAQTGWKQIDTTQTASASASLDFETNIDTTYDDILCVLTDIRPVTDAVDFYIRLKDTTFKSGASDYEYHLQILASNVNTYIGANSQGAAQILAATTIGNASTEGICGEILLSNPGAASSQNYVRGKISWGTSDATSILRGSDMVGFYNGAQAAISGIQFLFSSGNIASGTIAIYGLRK